MMRGGFDAIRRGLSKLLAQKSQGQPSARPPALRRKQEKQEETRQVRMLVSPGTLEGGRPRPTATKDEAGHVTVNFVEGKDAQFVLFSDGSFRHIHKRRRFGMSGRQLRIQRKAARRRVLAQRRAEAENVAAAETA